MAIRTFRIVLAVPEWSPAEHVLFAHIESRDRFGAGYLEPDDPMIQQIARADCFQRATLDQITNPALSAALDELRRNMGKHETHVFAISDPGGARVGSLVLLWTKWSDCGFVVLDEKGRVMHTHLGPTCLFFEDVRSL